jgi:histidyl-tRNA synthetase
MKDRKVDTAKRGICVFVAAVNDEVRVDALKLVCKLRKACISAELDVKKRNLARQLEYADALGIPFVAIVGKKELEGGLVKLRDMKARKETEVKVEDLTKILGERCP